MLIQLATILYVLVAVAMVALILMQRGGAGAGAGFGGGGGASATVFGARGASNFLSKSTKWLAILFFALSLGMAMYVAKGNRPEAQVEDLGIMGRVQQQSDVPAAGIPQAADAPAAEAPVADVPVAEEAAEEAEPEDDGSR